MASRNGKKTSGLRMLWIPGGRKSHPKGRFDSTSKKISYSTGQKKSQVWSLGGSKAQKDLLEADPDISLLDGPSTSGLSSLACASAVGSAAAAASAAAATTSAQCLESHNSSEAAESENLTLNRNDTNSPTTPNSTASTAPLLSPPQSPHSLSQPQAEEAYSSVNQPSNNLEDNNATMPAKSHQPIPVIVTQTTTAEIMEENRFSILGKEIITNELDIYSLPSPPKLRLNSQENLDSSSGTTISQITPSGSPHKTNESQNGSVTNTPVKKKHQHRNHNNNQGDVNSIESITADDDATSAKIPSGDLDWIDTVVQEQQDREVLAKPKKKKKKKPANAKELDQLDGVPMKENSTDASSIKEDDEKVVKCLYYTLMCCDCTIS